jgi:peptidoglycan biosynthesis protein MviN/MurJ (putative lipid II flippase)
LTAISAAVAVLLGFALEPSYGGAGAAIALLTASCVNFALVYFAVKRLVVTVPVHRQTMAPLAALEVSIALYLALAKWSVWLALLGGSAAYLAVLSASDGPQLVAFLRTFARNRALPG